MDIRNYHLGGAKTQTSTRHHHSFASEIVHRIQLHYLHRPISPEVTMPLEFVESQRGKPKLKHEGHLYCLLREKDRLKTSRCDKKQCKANATIFEGNVFTTREHLHEPDVNHSEQMEV